MGTNDDHPEELVDQLIAEYETTQQELDRLEAAEVTFEADLIPLRRRLRELVPQIHRQRPEWTPRH
jgi:hypothetical protein